MITAEIAKKQAEESRNSRHNELMNELDKLIDQESKDGYKFCHYYADLSIVKEKLEALGFEVKKLAPRTSESSWLIRWD